MPSSVLPEAKLSAIENLLEKTESNLKKIQITGEVFVLPVLNQWQYATRHMFLVLKGDAPERELSCVFTHLRRAYADSCDVLLTLKIEKAHAFIKRYNGVWPGLLNPEVFKTYVEAMYSGAAMQRDGNQFSPEDQVLPSRLDRMEATIAKMDACEKELQCFEPELEYALGRMRWRFAINIVMSILTMVAVALSVYSTLGR